MRFEEPLDERHLTETLGLDLQLTVHRDLFSRIRRCVSHAGQVEDGGKLIGYVEETHTKRTPQKKSVRLKVEGYIDSGPNANRSSVHLQPDGDYQEKVFRLLERYDPRLDPMGSCHAHHCNGLPTLSDGDILGYFQTVNDPNYNLNFFVAYLVKRLTADSVDGDFYLFVRDHPRFYRLGDSSLKILRGASRFQSLLAAAESLTRAYRAHPILPSQSSSGGSSGSSEERQAHRSNQILIADKHWLAQQFPVAQLRRDTQTKCLTWRWETRIDGQVYVVCATYDWPNALGLTAVVGQHTVAQCTVELNEARYERILNFIQSLKPTADIPSSAEGALPAADRREAAPARAVDVTDTAPAVPTDSVAIGECIKPLPGNLEEAAHGALRSDDGTASGSISPRSRAND